MRTQAVAVMIFTIVIGCNAFAQTTNKQTLNAPSRDSWADPSTGLMWMSKDNGKDVSWRGAIKYCRTLKLAGYTDWRLANMFELQGIFDKNAISHGLAGPHDDNPFEYHIKGNLFLTGDEWASRSDGRESHVGYAYYFDFNEGKSNSDPVGWPYPFVFRRALCVRGSGDPLGGQR